MFNRIWMLLVAAYALLTDTYGKIAWFGVAVLFVIWLMFPAFLTGTVAGFWFGVIFTLLLTPAKSDDD